MGMKIKRHGGFYWTEGYAKEN